MVVEWQLLFNVAVATIVALVAGLGGWILGRITRSIDQLDNDVRNMPLKYVTKEDYMRDIGELKALVQRIFDKLDGKVDKTIK